jgi:predicted CoA-binding protein
MDHPSLKDFFNPLFRYAVVGATTNREKYGYTVLKDLQQAGLQVVGVNPKYTEIEGTHIYPTLTDIPDRPDVTIFVVPPEVGLSLLPEVSRLGIARVWFQPGAESDTIRQRIHELKLKGVADGTCIMVVRRTLGAHG